MSRIISLEGQNVKRIKAVKLVPGEAGTFIVGGQPDQGKSTVLDMILYALAGKSALPPKPLRNGAKSGKIKIDLGETKHGHLIVERTFTEKGSALSIKSKDGYEAPSPQAILDDLCGKLTFDPLAFTRMKPKEQLATLRELVGIDTTALDDEKATVFQTRTGVNREVKQLEGELAGLAYYEDAPEAETSVAELGEQLQKATDHNVANGKVRSQHSDLERLVSDAKDTVAYIKQQIADLQEELAEQEKHVTALERDHKKLIAAVAELSDIDTAPIREQMRTVESTNAKVRANAKRAEVEAKLVSKQNRSKELTDRLDAIEGEKTAAVTSAKFPIEGLGFSDDYVTFEGIPFEQACTNTKIRVSAAMAIAMNKGLNVAMIYEGSLLGNESLAILDEMAKQHDFQIWIERVSEGDECAVIIEDGAVREDRAAEKEAVTV